ncbi:MAG: Lrp/AsnC family transcriptional regulator [Candidatus Bathyarchaeia archaeon]
MDDVDLKILSILCKDARVPFKEIATKLGITTETVRRRFKKLQKKGVILGTTVILSSKACGFKELVGFFIKIKSDVEIEEVKCKLQNLPKISEIWQEWGIYDFYVEAFLKDLSEIHDLLSNIRMIEEIMTVSVVVYKQQDWPIPFLISFPALNLGSS